MIPFREISPRFRFLLLVKGIRTALEGLIDRPCV
jgi:hypothetical protein